MRCIRRISRQFKLAGPSPSSCRSACSEAYCDPSPTLHMAELVGTVAAATQLAQLGLEIVDFLQRVRDAPRFTAQRAARVRQRTDLAALVQRNARLHTVPVLEAVLRDCSGRRGPARCARGTDTRRACGSGDSCLEGARRRRKGAPRRIAVPALGRAGEHALAMHHQH